jgi:hypothetical protein
MNYTLVNSEIDTTRNIKARHMAGLLSKLKTGDYSASALERTSSVGVEGML